MASPVFVAERRFENADGVIVFSSCDWYCVVAWPGKSYVSLAWNLDILQETCGLDRYNSCIDSKYSYLGEWIHGFRNL